MNQNNTIAKSHREYIKRKEVYKSFGYDIDKERNFIIEKSQPIFGNILEVGTGKGHFALALAKEGYTLTTLDISQEEQESARLNIKQHGLDSYVDFKIETAEAFSFADSSFDIIFLVNTLHHLAKPYKVIDEVVRVVSYEGKIILSDFTEEGFKIIDEIHANEGKIHQANKAKLCDIEKYLIANNFNIKKYKNTYQEILIAYHQII